MAPSSRIIDRAVCQAGDAMRRIADRLLNRVIGRFDIRQRSRAGTAIGVGASSGDQTSPGNALPRAARTDFDRRFRLGGSTRSANSVGRLVVRDVMALVTTEASCWDFKSNHT
jgi:hypothetical protein